MGVKFGLPVAQIKHTGLFDYPKLLKEAREWISDSGFEFHENAYKHKVPSPKGAEQEIEWMGWRNHSAYVRYVIEVYFHVFEIKEVDVVKDGKTKKMWSARMFVEISGYVDLDYNGYFEMGNSKFLLGLRDWIHKFLLWGMIQGAWTDELYYRMYKLHHLMKQNLNMSTPTDSSRYRY